MPNSFPSSIAEHDAFTQKLHQNITARLRLHDYHSADMIEPLQASFSVYKISGSSRVGDAYSFTVTFVSDENIAIEELADTNASLLLKDENNPLLRKEVHGKIFSVQESGSVARRKLYTIEIVSPLRYLALNKSYKIYQDKNVAEIISEIILKYSSLLDLRIEVKVDLQTLAKRETCTQYGQSDLDFIKMLCEEEGLSLLSNSAGAQMHTVTLCELNEHSPLSKLPCECSYNLSKSFKASAHKENYYDANRPSVAMAAEKGKQRSSHSMPDNEKTSELRSTLGIEHLRDRVEKLDESLYKDLNRYTHLDALRSECDSIRILGSSHELLLSDAMNTLLLDTKTNKKLQAIILSVQYEGHFPNALDEYVSGTEADSVNYKATFTAIPADLIYKPSLSRLTQDKPRISGITTAIVANGEKTPQDHANTIDIDEKGRIRVIFHFDPKRPTSIYIPISNIHSGDGYGAQFIPRVNSEVIVEFINGDIDRPVITGAIHNGENAHPYNLPKQAEAVGKADVSSAKEKTKSFIKTQTTPQYEDKEGYNELLFEDRQNHELLSLRAQNDYENHVLHDAHIHVENSAKSIIGADCELTVQNDLIQTTGNDHKVNIGANAITAIEKDQITTVKEDQEVNILEDQISIVNENRTTIVEQDLIKRIKGQLTRYVEKDAQKKYLQSLFDQVGKELGVDVKGAFELKAGSIKNTAGTAEFDGADGVSLKVGGNVLTVDSSGIHFKTPLYDANSGNAGVSSSAVNIADLIAPAYQKLRVTEITGLKKQSAIDETLTYTAKVEKFENDEWKPATDLEETQKLQLNWHFIKNNEVMDTDIITENITDDDIEINGLELRVSLQEDNIQQFGHIHAYFSDPENEGYFNTELKRDVKVEEIKGNGIAQVNEVLQYTLKLNIDNPTDEELKTIKAKMISIDKDNKATSTEYPLDKSLTLACQTSDTVKSVQINAHTTNDATLIETKQTEIRPLHEEERANLHISSEAENYIFQADYKTSKLTLNEAINQEDGTAVQYHFILKDGGGKSYTTSEKEAHVEGKKLSQTFELEELCQSVKLELSHLASFTAYVDVEGDTKNTGTIKYAPILKHDVWKRDSVLNASADASEPKAYKKTTPLTKGEEVKRIQEALQKMNINIGKDGVDGVFGNDGHNAVMTFQENYKPTHNVHQYTWGEPDGIVGKNTLLAMDEALVGGWRYIEPEICCGEKYKTKVMCTRYGSTYGPVYWGELKLVDYKYWHELVSTGKVTEEEKDIIIGMSENEGKLDSVQSYDSEIATVGAMQKTINPNGKGEYTIQVEEFKSSNPEKYTELFANCGWTVQNGKIFYKDPENKTAGKLTGSALKTLIRTGYNESNFGTNTVRCKPIEALVRASKDKDFQAKQVIDFINRLKVKVLPIKPAGYKYTLNQYLKSKLGKATVLDQHINRPAYVDDDFALALNNFFDNNPTVNKNPTIWGEQHGVYEKIILDDYGVNRRGTDMSVRYNKLKKAFA